MSTTSIEWTERTWNPVKARLPLGMNLHQHKGLKILQSGTWGYHCEPVSPGCKNCYAESMNKRTLPAWGTGLAYNAPNRQRVEIFLDVEVLRLPLKSWQKDSKVFVCSMTDLFGEFVPESMIADVFDVMDNTPHHTYQVLTKRAERMYEFMTEANRSGRRVWPPRNVWLGVSVEDQQRADERIPHLLKTPAAVRFLSVEPLLGSVDLYLFMPWTDIRDRHFNTGIDWVIVGGESGPGARPMHPVWASDIRDQCLAAGVPFFFKQWGEDMPARVSGETWETLDGQPWPKKLGTPHKWGDGFGSVRVGKKKAGRLLDGQEWNQMPSSYGVKA